MRDLPLPQATAVVCTALAEKLRLRPDQVNMRVASLGHCSMADVEVSVFRFWPELKGGARTVAGQPVREGDGHAFGDPGGRAWAAVVIAEQPYHVHSDGTVPEIIAVSAAGRTDPGPLVDHLATALRLR
ncbi:hypothetical protein ACFQV2_23600 [Actinokineospora soli]|uniref:Uncharacterized protein n=1 Tax=Actinokineospora soli TaxID=1048753 RepID=A0ABW2TQE9_9PSEU